MTYDWTKIIDWKLLTGSHDFPGPDGGTCINEAAIIAAGFEYKKVQSAADCPPCFSPVLSAYLIGVNDLMPDDERQKLMPFVMRLSGSADSPAIEQQRLELITLRTVQRHVSSAMRAANLPEQTSLCQAVRTFDECGRVAARAAMAAGAAGAARAAASAENAAWAARAAESATSAARAAASAESAAWAASDAAWAASAARAASAASAASAAARAARAAASAAPIYANCISIAEEAFAIGKQADALDISEVRERLERAKEAQTA